MPPTRLAPRSPQPVSLASPRPTPVTPPIWSGLALAVLVVASTDMLLESPTVGARQSEFPCLFASGEASGSERLRLPPQVGPQPTHPVRQSIAWHSEVDGNVGVTPAVYYPAI